MEDFDSSVQLKEKLLIAGMEEITVHGISGFSLRRVAAACGASCSAPYKHFRNKEDFIEQIASYVEKRWAMLAAHIIKTIEDDRHCIAELCIANVKFRIANPLYGQSSLGDDKIIYNEAAAFFRRHDLPDMDAHLFIINALVTGTAELLTSGRLENNASNMDILRSRILEELKFQKIQKID